jgi:hypothetical protein
MSRGFKIALIAVGLGFELFFLLPNLNPWPHGEAFDTRYRHKERLEAFMDWSLHPSPTSRATWEQELKLLHHHEDWKMYVILGLLVTLNGMAIYYIICCTGKERQTRELKRCRSKMNHDTGRMTTDSRARVFIIAGFAMVPIYFLGLIYVGWVFMLGFCPQALVVWNVMEAQHGYNSLAGPELPDIAVGLFYYPIVGRILSGASQRGTLKRTAGRVGVWHMIAIGLALGTGKVLDLCWR